MNIVRLAVLCALCCLASLARAQDAEGGEAKALEMSVSVDGVSRYVWRGLVLNDDPALQPSFTAAWSGFSVGLWGSLDLTDSTTRQYSPYTSGFLAYQVPGHAENLSATFPISPFPGIDILTLLQGKIHLAVGPQQEGAVGGGIIDHNGGTVNGNAGTRIEIPAGATSAAIPVRIFPVSSGSLLTPIPEVPR